ncbi:MAG: heavy-metal-associated domain-containing protein [Armatimonadota bacterium]
MASELQTKTIKVRGITCADCVTTIAGGVKRLPGTQKVSGNLTQSTVKVAFEPDKVSLEEIVKAIEGVGYPVERVED